MSSKSTLLHTGFEHWYTDCNSQYYDDTKENDAITIEIDKMHRVETDEEGTTIIIEKGTPLYNEIMKRFGGKRSIHIIGG